MKRLGALVLIALGAGLILLGLLFAIGMAGELRRLAIAGVALAAGALAAGYGLRRYRQADAESPEQLRAEILALARVEDGEIAVAEVEAKLGRRAPLAAAILAELERQGRCQPGSRDGASYYVFPELQPRLMIRRCEYCSFELPLSKQLSECPRCGGSLVHRIQRQSSSKGAAYGMDED
jgi:hypothetical protein